MASDHKDVELRVRARDYSKKTLDEITDALKDLISAQDDQITAARRGEASAASLEKSYTKMESAVASLSKQFALTKSFEYQAQKLERLKAAADLARDSQAAYVNSLSSTGKQTKEQTAQLLRLERAVKNADSAQLKQQTTVDNTTAKLQKFGIATANIADTQRKIAAAVEVGNSALAKQDTALDNYEASLRGFRKAQEDLASEAKARADREAQAATAMLKASKEAQDANERLRANSKQLQEQFIAQEQAEALVLNGMRNAADQALASARGYQTLARAVTSIRSNEVSAQIKAIVDPTRAASESLAGLGGIIDRVSARAQTARGPIKGFRDDLQALQTAQAGISNIAAQVDAYQRQIEALRTARSEYTAARTAVTALADKMRTGAGDATELSRAMAAAQTSLKTAATNMQQTAQRANDMRTGLRAAGVNTRDLAGAQTTLVSQANRSKKAVDDLRQAYDKYGTASDKAANSQFKFFTGGRTTLSFVQRMRGEVLALATAYVGIQGAVNLASSALQAYRDAQKIESQLGALTGNDAEKTRDEWNYLLMTANRIGFSFQEVAGAYAKFAIASKAAGANTQETRFIFEKFATAARVAGQSTEEFEGILKAVEQMMSKGKIQAEELRGQLGDRLPGAFSLAAKAAGVTVVELNKMLEAGEFSSDYVINIAREVGKTYQATDKALNSLAATEARFNNAAFAFKNALAEGGFVQAYTDFLKKLTELMQGEDGAKLAQGLSDTFSAVLKVLQYAAENLDTVKTVMMALAGITLVGWGVGVIGTLTTTVKAMLALSAAIKGFLALNVALPAAIAGIGAASTGAATGTGLLTGAIGILRIALTGLMAALGPISLALAAFAAAYAAISTLKPPQLPKGPISDIPNLTDAQARAQLDEIDQKGSRAPKKGQVGPTPDPGTGPNAGDRAALALKAELEKNKTKLEKAEISSRLSAAKRERDERIAIVSEQYDNMKAQATAGIADETKRAAVLVEIEKQKNQAIAIEDRKYHTENDGRNQAAADRRVQLQQQVRMELERIADDLAKNEAKLDPTAPFEKRLTTRMEAITHAYDKLQKTINNLAKVDPPGAKTAQTELNNLIKQQQAVEDTKARLDEIKRLEDELTNQQRLRTELLDRNNALYNAGRLSQAELLADNAKINTSMDTAIQNAAKNLRVFAEANAKVLTATDRQQINTRVDVAEADGSVADKTNAYDAINQKQEQLNAILAQREVQLGLIDEQRQAGILSEDAYAERVNATNAMFQETIVAMTTTIAANAEVLARSGTVTVEQQSALQNLIVKMQALGFATANARLQAGFLQASFNKLVATGIDAHLDAAATAMADVINGQKSIGEGFQGMIEASMAFFSQFLMDIAKAIIKQIILNALAGSSNPYVAAAGIAGGGVRTLHSGGVVGGPSPMTRSGGIFADAPRFHNGGLPGLSSDEVLTVLQKGEEVLAKGDARNVLNSGGMPTAGSDGAPGAGGAGGMASGSSPTQLKVVNAFDAGSFVSEGLSSPEGGEAILNHVRANKAQFKAILGN